MFRGTTCCTTPSALCFWGAAFLVLYGGALLAGELWPAAADYQLAMVLGAIGGACLVNAAINRTYHCYSTGPLFLILGGGRRSGHGRPARRVPLARMGGGLDRHGNGPAARTSIHLRRVS